MRSGQRSRHCIAILVPRSAKRSLPNAPLLGSASSALGTRVATSTADTRRTVGGDLLRSPSLIDRWAVRPAGLMLGNIPNSTNSAVLKTAVPSGTTLCHTSANSQLAVQVSAQIVPKAQANLVLPESHKNETNLGHTQRLPESLTRRVHSAAAKSPLRAFGGEHRPQFGSTSTC